MEGYFGLIQGGHTYTVATVGLKKQYYRCFGSRQQANEYMYRLCKKFGLSVTEVYDDKHDKTYKCQNGVRFFIQRAR